MQKRAPLALGLVAASISALAENDNKIPPPKQNQPAQIEAVVTFQAGDSRASFSGGSDGLKGVIDTSIGTASVKSDGKTAQGTEISSTANLGKFEMGAGCSADGSTCTTTDKTWFGLKEEETKRKYTDGKGNPISRTEYEAAVKRDFLSPEVAPVRDTESCTKWGGVVPVGGVIGVGGSSASCTESVVSAPMDKFCRDNPADSQCSSAVPPSTKISSETVEIKGTVGGGYKGAKAEMELSHTTKTTFKSSNPGDDAHKDAYNDKVADCLSVLESGSLKSECLQSPQSGMYRSEQEAVTIKGSVGAKVKDIGAETSLKREIPLDEKIKISTPSEDALREFERRKALQDLPEELGDTANFNSGRSRMARFRDKSSQNEATNRQRMQEQEDLARAREKLAARQSAAYSLQQQLQLQQVLQQITPAVTPKSTNQPRSPSLNNAAPATGSTSRDRELNPSRGIYGCGCNGVTCK